MPDFEKWVRYVIGPLAVLAVVFLAGCSSGPPPRGTIVGMHFVPAHDQDRRVDDYTTVCVVGSNGFTNCYPVYAGSHIETDHYPDAWYADLEECLPGRGCRKSTTGIEKREFDTWILGGMAYPFQRIVDKCVNDPKNTENANVLACIRRQR